MRELAPVGLILAGLLACQRPNSLSTPPVRSEAPGIRTTGEYAGTVIINATLIDGTGGARRRGGLRIVGDRIADIGVVEVRPGETVVDAGGQVLAPGFIDTHSHADGDLADDTTALAAVSQGITTVIGGQDGGSPARLDEFFAGIERHPPPINVGMYAGHGSIRMQVMGGNYRRRAEPHELAAMRALLRTQLAAGALGLSSGLEYDPGIYSTTDELLVLAKETAAAGGRYISHIRSEDFAFWKAIDEIITIGRVAKLPVQISHSKLAMRSLRGQADSLIGILDRARSSGVDITADIYPYLYWQSTLTVLFPKRDFENRASAEFALTETSTPGGILLSHYAPNAAYAGKTVAEVAAMRGVDSVTALVDLIRDAEAMKRALGAKADSIYVESIIATSMVERDVERIMRWPFANLCTDGSLTGNHPRSFGSYPRFFGRYVRERQVMSLEEAVRRTTSLAALHMGLKLRGTLAVGNFADLVLFDPTTMIYRATPGAPHLVSTGVSRVWVNGTPVWVEGIATGARAGRVIRR